MDVVLNVELGGAFVKPGPGSIPRRMAREDRFLSSLPDLRAAIANSPASLLFYAYTQPSPAVVKALGELGIPCYPTPVRAARALAHESSGCATTGR